MTHLSPTTKRLLSGVLMALFVVGLVSFGVFVSQPVLALDQESITGSTEAHAALASGACTAGGPAPVPCPPRGIFESLRSVSEKIVSPTFRIALIQALLNLSQFVLNRLAYEAAVSIASGGPGEGSLFYQQTPAEAFGQLGLEVAGEAVGVISELSASELGIEFNLCQPTLDAIQLAIALGIKQKYQPTAPKCDILEVGRNWTGFFTSVTQTITDPDARREAILKKFAESLKPGKNELSATLRINIAIDQKVHEQKLLQFLEQNEREYKSVTDFITGLRETPSETLQANFETRLQEVHGDKSQIKVGELVNAGELIGGLALSTASTFTNVLLSQLLNRIYTGLFETEPLPDPFDLEAVAGGDKEAAQERFASIIATNPIATTDYNALSEFVVCMAEGVTNRGLYNCVMDVNFLAAVSRGNSGSAITVQEAIDEGLLNGDWPLISPENEPANQDPFCYTYGYCYGNLVKLRKARVLPIGWELAALRNSATNPATLQEVIDGFDECTEDGTIGPANASDSDSKWCHLIDPNWVLKYPETQCRAIVNGEIRISTLSPGRSSVCVDAPSCIREDNDGNCTGGYGYCVQEKNVWRFRGDECPEQFATCLSFENTETGEQGDFLVNTVDYSVCDQDNAGCRWYRTNKYYEDAGTSDDPSDDTYEWLPDGETYTNALHDDDWNYQTSSGSAATRETYAYTSDSGETYEYTTYAYEDRLYLTNNASECSEEDAGCAQLYAFDENLILNAVQNPSFEDDEDDDGAPDAWVSIGGTYSQSTSRSAFGSASILLSPSATHHLEQFVGAAENNFYTFSVSFLAGSSGDDAQVQLSMLDEDGNNLDASGTASAGDCEWDAVNDRYEMDVEPSVGEFERFECVFTTIEDTRQVHIVIANPSTSFDDISVDAVQLELGEDANAFTVGYSTTPEKVYYKIAPNWLGCSGSESDPSECENYTQVCSAQDVGCRLYTPEDGDPSVPAIISELDECPSECVGYSTYKQEATPYESEQFPVYFIASSATTCSEQYVACDAYTNLASAEAGGEEVEYYTSLRFCLSEDIADGSSAVKTPATYFTWEGSDKEGYQLQTWYLLKSNYTGSTNTFDVSGFEETSPGLAPCTHVRMDAENEVVCRDSTSMMQRDVWSNEDCDSHDDIFDNPDCREFFDTEGNIHYRQYSDTISISDECAPYRKDESTEDDCEESGGFWTDQGFCRYYVLSGESTQCPAEQSGCREYTGGTGRNATTILSENFESGTYDNFAIADSGRSPREISISNESVATDGHSLYVLAPPGGLAGFETQQIYLSSTLTDVYDVDTSSTCTSHGGTVSDTGCEVTNDIDGDGSDDESCTISDGEESCGTLTDSLVGGKTFMLDFWAKGSGNLYVTFQTQGGTGSAYDLVNPVGIIVSVNDLTPLELSGSWTLYSLGPLDTSGLDDFDENAVLRFAAQAGEEFYIDNIRLKQAEENVTLIKDSWVVPSTCDQTPDGVDSDQYYLGCEAYTDQEGNDATLYQFSDVCSEEVVGCEGFFHTANSESAYQEISNARCVYSTNTDLTDGETVTSNTTCEINDIEYCTILTGREYCTFDVEGAFESPLPLESAGSGVYFGIVYGPETVVTAADTPLYLVADDDFACSQGALGCQEVGEPVFSQDQTGVESFESVYFVNLPEEYDNILCEQEALFCEEWSSTQDGNFYFKHPLDKTCEYKTGVTIENQSYVGWFRTGTSEPCYWEDKDGSGDFDIDADEEFLIAGEEFGVWRNGDEDDGDDDLWDYYDGWVAECASSYDLCTEFIDVVDTGGGLNESGQSYYFTNDELLDDESLTDNQRCNGQVSQKFGCALFNNTTISELSYNASASYVSSVHADIFYGEEENALVDPISCSVDGGGVFELSTADAEMIGLTSSDTDVDLCARRCEYTLESGDSITTSSAEFVSGTSYYERSCLVSSDCPVLTSYLGEEATGTCTDVDEYYQLADDSNEVLKVNRDRTCASWIAGVGGKTSWNTLTNKYDLVYDSIDYCVEGSVQGDLALCTKYVDREPIILNSYLYSSRDVNWSGYEYSGNAIPNQLPIELYDQFNTAAQSVCVDTSGVNLKNDDDLPISCNTFADCPTAGATCSTDSQCTSANFGACDEDSGTCFYSCVNSSETDYRLVYNAGPCDSTEAGDGNGGECIVGQCSSTGVACAEADDCATDEECVVGYCQATGDTDCVNEDCSCNPDNNTEDETNPDCDGVTASGLIATEVCDPVQFVCVDELTTDEAARDACVTSGDCGVVRECVPASSSTVGSCYNNRCLSDIIDSNGDGWADRLSVDTARGQSCRGYPEIDSPFPADVVDTWLTYSDATIDDDGVPPSSATSPEFDQGTASLEEHSLPYTYVNGFQDSNVCGIDADGNVVDCLCSYDKTEYGQGTTYRYFERGTGIETVPQGICSGGPVSGIPCINNDDCTINDQTGTCSYVSRVDTVYGWSGYCIERDSSIQTLGSAEAENQACLSWLPVDQLTGGTDLYAKHTSAGYSPQTTYYCAEVEMGWTVGTSDIACAEVQDGNCNDNSWQQFRNEADDSSNKQDDCIAGVWCPDGFFAVMTGCGANDTENQCTGGEDDCPYFCVPKLSYKTSDNTTLGAYAGDPCVTPDEALGISVDSPPYTAKSTSDAPDEAYYININAVGDHWAGSKAPNTRVYVLKLDQFSDAKAFYNDCEARGVVDSVDDFSYSEYTGGGVGGLLSSYSTGGTSDEGFRGLTNNFVPEAVCTTVVQVSSKTPKNEAHGQYKTYNAAWTDRLWDSEKNTYNLSTLDDDYLGYIFSTAKEPYGAATDYLQLQTEIDPVPHQLVMCQDSTDNSQTLPTVDLDSTACDGDITSLNGEDARAYRDVSIITASGKVDPDYCYNSDCDCEDTSSGTGEEKDEWCNWDDSLGAAAYCGSGTCENDSSISCAFTDADEDGVHDDCSSVGGDCTGGICIGGGNAGDACSEDTKCWVNYCHGSYDTSSGVLTKATCVALDSAPAYSLSTSDLSDAISSLSQLFGRIYGMVAFTDDGYGDVDTGALPTSESIFDSYSPLGTFRYLDIDDDDDYADFIDDYSDWEWDTRGSRDNPQDYVPVVVSVGDCEGTTCYEAVEKKFTVNETDDGDIEGEGTMRATVNFFTYADSDQMPIRRIVVDWGDDFASIPSDMPWPTGSQSGSIASDNFYKNHRGLDPISDEEECSDTPEKFGQTSQACSTSYVSFTHDYTCTIGRLEQLETRACEFDDDGRLLNSPCYDGEYCVFQPRVHVMDNWGWCTGFCDAGDDATEGCYTGVLEDGSTQNECNITYCPSENNPDSLCDDSSGGTVNPWINYDGAVYILAE